MHFWYSWAKYALLLSHNGPRFGKCRQWEKVIRLLKHFFTISWSASPSIGDAGEKSAHRTQGTSSLGICMLTEWRAAGCLLLQWVFFPQYFLEFSFDIFFWPVMSTKLHFHQIIYYNGKVLFPSSNIQLRSLHSAWKIRIIFSHVSHFEFIWAEFHLSLYHCHSLSSGPSAIRTQPLSLVPWII